MYSDNNPTGLFRSVDASVTSHHHHLLFPPTRYIQLALNDSPKAMFSKFIEASKANIFQNPLLKTTCDNEQPKQLMPAIKEGILKLFN